MLTLDLLAQVYLISLLVGGGFIIFNFCMGQIGHHGSDHHSLHLPGGHDATGHDTAVGHGGSTLHQIGHNVGHSLLHDTHHSAHHTHEPFVHGDSPNSQSQDGSSNFISADIAQKFRRRLQILVQSEDIPSRIGMLAISLFSPMHIAILLTFLVCPDFLLIAYSLGCLFYL